MSNYTFRPAKRENVGLWINLVGGTGGGKTYTAMRLAHGIAGDKPFAVIDTENRRALHYADQFRFDHAELREPFTPESYADAITAADAAGYPVIIVDSGSHVWAGDGGMLDMQEAEFQRMGAKDSAKMASWIKPKRAHKKMVSKMLQLKAHLIFCLRAEEKIEMVKENGRMIVRAKQSMTGKDGWIPICDKNLPFEATCSFLLLASNPGIPHPIKLQEQHRAIFPLDQPITEAAGKRLAEWASGSANASPPPQVSGHRERSTRADATEAGSAAGAPSETRAETLKRLCEAAQAGMGDLLAKAEVAHPDEMSADDWDSLKAMLGRRIKRLEAAAQA